MAEKQLVVFKLGEEEYGVSVNQVREIVRYSGTVNVPSIPDFVEGVINLREKVIPVIKMATFFQMLENEGSEKEIIIIELQNHEFGIIVDKASEVMRINDSLIKEPPTILSSNSRLIEGVYQQNGRLIIMLDLSMLLMEEEIYALKQVS